MHVLVAPDCFNGTLTAVAAAEAIAAGWRRHDPMARMDLAPLSDGGPGFVAVLAASVPGELHEVRVSGPLGGTVRAQVLRTADGTVYVESAQVCGPALPPPPGRRPLEASTAGVGELLRAVLDRLAPTRVVVGVGGTATTDGGRGAVEAFGGPQRWPRRVPLVVATDADASLPGTDGAGGGLGDGLMVLGGARVSGVQAALEAVGLPERAAAADLLVTGAGTFDGTSLLGKVPKGVAWVAQRAGRPCVVLAGRVMIGRREFSSAGVDAAYSVEDGAGSPVAVQDRLGPRLADLAERVARTWTPRSS